MHTTGPHTATPATPAALVNPAPNPGRHLQLVTPVIPVIPTEIQIPATGRIIDTTPDTAPTSLRWHTMAHQLTALATRIRPHIRPALIITLKTLAGLTALAAAGGVIYIAVMAVLAFIALVTTVVTFIAGVIAWITSHLLLIAVIGVALLFLGAKTGACSGIHCGGCRH